jgi:hypothetical protein
LETTPLNIGRDLVEKGKDYGRVQKRRKGVGLGTGKQLLEVLRLFDRVKVNEKAWTGIVA